ncbi:fibronectin type III domain-containing protein 10 [Sphaeramia orbicularis]|uniref:Fibronectin type III domain containing 10 n=1 Tax=Sphaeramia orbicularis TaxID=375764 RepID=A0A673C7E8_9TELE|nr:fibronectin type III domain-containing protein 10 [Sphaeramia orbicularis]
MKRQQPPSLLALSALLLCTLQQTAASVRSDRNSSASSSSSSSLSSLSSTVSSQVSSRKPQDWQKLTFNYGNQSLTSRPSPKLKEASGHVNSFSFNTSRGNITTVISKRSGRTPSLSPEEEVSPLCAYRVIEGGIGGQLCFRDTLFGYKCQEGECRTVVSYGSLVANILINGSVLLQWTHEGESTMSEQNTTKETVAGQKNGRDPKTNSTRVETLKSRAVFSSRRHRRGGYELSCWWNGSYTQFECAGVHLASGCRDFLLTELHENIPYRLCLRSLEHSTHSPAQTTDRRDCVEFTLPPSGMQDIVIAMTTVGGAICVMLVIICLLVAYITENIMSPTTQHTYSYRTHSRH